MQLHSASRAHSVATRSLNWAQGQLLQPSNARSHSTPSLTLPRRDQDRLLPIANISRIMKRALPGNAKIAKDAKETVQECLSEFISFITSE